MAPLRVLSPHKKFRSHRKAHNTVVANEYWYGKGPPFLGKSFTAKKAIRRHGQISKILKRAARRERRNSNKALAGGYCRLYSRLKHCRPRRRCGLTCCPKCARAFQRAKVDAHLNAITELAQNCSGRKLVMVTIIAKRYARSSGDFLTLDPLKANRWLRDVLDRNGIRRVVIGSIDFGWEKRAGERYLQLHWHLAMWTKNATKLRKKLKKAFKVKESCKDPTCKRPIDVAVTEDLNFVPYVHKLIKLPKLLRTARRQLPELVGLLGRYDPMDFMFLRKVRLSAQSDGIVFKEIGSKTRQNS